MKKINFNPPAWRVNWGTGIIISCAIFMTATVIAGVTFMNQKVDLVAEDYYEEELRYQNQIDIINRTAKDEFEIEYLNNKIQLSFKDSSAGLITGEIHFYRPSDSSKDFTVPIKLDEQSNQLINTEKIDKGFWKVQLSWALKNQEFYFEKAIIIN